MTGSTRARWRSRLTACGWPAESHGSALRAVIVVTDLVAVVASVFAVAAISGDAAKWGSLALLICVAIAFEEGVHRSAQLKIRLSSDLHTDMTSVWMVAGAIALDAGRAVILLVVVLGFTWFRQQRPAGDEFDRQLFADATGVIGALVASATFHGLMHATAGSNSVAHGLLPVLGAIAASAVANRVPVTAALIAMGMRGKELAGSTHDNLIELATLSLGGLVAAAMLYEPWLAILVLGPMVTLQRGALVRDLETAAITDAKTGLLNAMAWEQLARRELLRAERAGQRAAILIIDIDRFKMVNDRFGHLIGDKVIAGVARCVKESLRAYDGLGRFGGEEFVAVLPDSGEHDSLVVAERIRLRVNQLCVADLADDVEDGDSRAAELLSVSIGVAVLPADGAELPELPELLHAADQALYRAKWNGRNQVQLARRGDQIPDTVAL